MIDIRQRAGFRSTMSLSAVLCLAATGCHHKGTAVWPPPGPPPPIPLATAPDPAKPAVVEPVPLPPMPTVAAKPPARPRRKPATPAAPAAPAAPAEPTQVASAEPPPAASVIGALTTGGDTSPQTRQQAADTIASIDRRLKALSANFLEEQKKQVTRIRNFARQAQAALNSGDVDGATTLATKAKLLLDDLLK